MCGILRAVQAALGERGGQINRGEKCDDVV